MGTITLTTDIPNERIGVQLTSWASPANGSVSVKRVHPDTTEWDVRGSQLGGTWATSGGQAFAWDYEAPFGDTVTYYAFDGATKVTASTSLAISYSLLRAPGLPANDALLRPMGKPDFDNDRPAVKLSVLGRDTPIVLADSRKSDECKLVARTKSVAEYQALRMTLNGSTTFLLLMPGMIDAWRYVDIGPAHRTPVVRYKAPTGAPSNHIAYWWDWTLPCTVVGRPTGGIYGDPTASYQAIKDTYATYTALKAAKATYLDVLKGI